MFQSIKDVIDDSLQPLTSILLPYFNNVDTFFIHTFQTNEERQIDSGKN